MTYSVQVSRSHYEGKAYRSQERWSSYWHQLALVRSAGGATVLEVGVGEGVVARQLASEGTVVTTLDVAEDLQPDVVGSVTALPFPNGSFDVVLAAEVLEHIRFEDVPQALSELRRVARRAVVISIPHPGYVISFIVKLPLLRRLAVLFKIPFFWKKHQFNGEHYWELGKWGYMPATFLRLAKDAGLALKISRSYPDDPAHHFFLFTV